MLEPFKVKLENKKPQTENEYDRLVKLLE